MEESLDKFKERPRQKILINLDFEGNVHSDNFIQSFHLSEGMYMEKLMIAMIRVWLEKAWEREYNVLVAWLLGQPPSLLHCCAADWQRCTVAPQTCSVSPLHSSALVAQLHRSLEHNTLSFQFPSSTWLHIVLQVICSSQLHFLPRQRCASQGFHCTESKARLAGGRLLLNVHRRWADYLLVGRD